jgi:hypothetical protein
MKINLTIKIYPFILTHEVEGKNGYKAAAGSAAAAIFTGIGFILLLIKSACNLF